MTALQTATADARAAGLRYYDDSNPGIRRVRHGRGFAYVDAGGHRAHQSDVERARHLAIPPAWTDVWISPIANGHLQATGHDARGRKQYRYHAAWRSHRDANKYDNLLGFGAALRGLRRRVTADLRKGEPGREVILAAVVRLLDVAAIRIGNQEYARTNNSFGLTTLRARHASVEGNRTRFNFRGKSGVVHSATIFDPRLARIIRQCQELPGHELFQYVGDDGERHRVGSADVNDYIHEVMGDGFSAKDFRTWAGTVHAAEILHATEGDAEPKTVVAAIDEVAKRLGNTRAVARSCYVHPAVIEAFLDERLSQYFAAAPRRGLSQAESAVLRLLESESRRQRTTKVAS